MSNDGPTLGDVYGVLLGMKEDLGGLKASNELLVKGLTNHAERIATLEQSSAKQKGAVKAWGAVATGVASLVAAAPALFKLLHK